jgi:hypothetical protein
MAGQGKEYCQGKPVSNFHDFPIWFIGSDVPVCLMNMRAADVPGPEAGISVAPSCQPAPYGMVAAIVFMSAETMGTVGCEAHAARFYYK